ncbi:MAG: hypothetical protein WBN22_00160 [Verrucomicrobiia bacterium]
MKTKFEKNSPRRFCRRGAGGIPAMQKTKIKQPERNSSLRL